jgi:hypothetical protein
MLCWVADDLVAGLPHVLPAVLEVEDPNQGLIAEELGGLVDEVGSRIGDPHQLLALQSRSPSCWPNGALRAFDIKVASDMADLQILSGCVTVCCDERPF